MINHSIYLLLMVVMAGIVTTTTTAFRPTFGKTPSFPKRSSSRSSIVVSAFNSHSNDRFKSKDRQLIASKNFKYHPSSTSFKMTANPLSCLFSTSDHTTANQPNPVVNSSHDNDDIEATPSPPKAATISKVLADDKDFIKSQLDKRKYRSIVLPTNKLQILLVSDPETDVEAAAVHIKAGHFDDPVHRAGLAHFHEHMLFLGTEKYPVENEFEEYLAKNGGSSNAYTDMEDTNYYLSVAPLDHGCDEEEEDERVNDDNEQEKNQRERKVSTALSGALDRFAQFFVAPLFNPDSVERELRAINSEYLNGMTSDSWKNFQLLKHSSNATHPFAKFGCGNYHTLTNGGDVNGVDAIQSGGSSPRDDLVTFWKEKYVAENMRVAIVGRANLDELQGIVEKTFTDVRLSSSLFQKQQELNMNGKLNPLFRTEHVTTHGVVAFGSNQLGIVREVIPFVEIRQVKLYFATPPMNDPTMKESRPFRAISHLLGHESPGSLHSLLAEEGLINGLASGVAIDTSDFSLSTVSLTLTPKGMDQLDHVLSLVWQWINMVKSAVYNNDTLMEKYDEELRQISRTNFKFREYGDPTDFCSAAAEASFHFEPAEILVGSAMPQPYNRNVTTALMNRLTPENCMITILDPDLEKKISSDDENELNASTEPWQIEKWYGAKYRQKNIPSSVKAKWSYPSQNADLRLKLPKLNEFLPEDFSLRANDATSIATFDASVDYSKEKPKLLVDKPGLRMWHKMDRTFRVPKTALRLHLFSPNVYQSPRSITLNRIFEKVLRDDLNSYVYDASLSGCNFKVSCLPSGFSISVSGYSEKTPHLLDVVTSRILSIIEELKEGPERRSGLSRKFNKAMENLLRETKNYRLEAPYETANYAARMMIENNVWHVNSYIAELEGEYAERNPVTMEECGKMADESLKKRLSAELLCMGNIDENGAHKVVQLIRDRFLNQARPLELEEIPKTFSLKIPTMEESVRIFGNRIENTTIPIVLQEVAYSETEENNCVEFIIQTGSQHEMGVEGVALLNLISHIAETSAFDQLRTKEQLGYIVSASMKVTGGGGLGFAVIVQSSSTVPPIIEERIEKWLVKFREELDVMSSESMAMEATAVVAQLLERDMRFRDEVASSWGEILAASRLGPMYNKPCFNRLEKLAAVLNVVEKQKTADNLKRKVLHLWDTYFTGPQRRVISCRVYSKKTRAGFDENVGKANFLSSYDEVKQIKQFLPQFAVAPYWIEKN